MFLGAVFWCVCVIGGWTFLCAVNLHQIWCFSAATTSASAVDVTGSASTTAGVGEAALESRVLQAAGYKTYKKKTEITTMCKTSLLSFHFFSFTVSC